MVEGSPQSTGNVTAVGNRICIIDANNGGLITQVRFPPDEHPLYADFAGMSTRFVSSQKVGPDALEETTTLWDARTGARLQTLKGLTSSAAGAIHDDLILTHGPGLALSIWSMKSGELLRSLSVPMESRGRSYADEGGVYERSTHFTTASFSMNGSLILASQNIMQHDAAVDMWDAKSGEYLGQLATRRDSTDNVTDTARREPAVRSIAFSPRTNLIAVNSGLGRITVLDVKGRRRLAEFVSEHEEHDDETRRDPKFAYIKGVVRTKLFFSPDERWLLIWHQDKIQVMSIVNKNRSTVVRAHEGGVGYVAFMPDSAGILTASDSYGDRTIRLSTLLPHAGGRILFGHTKHVTMAAFFSDGTRLATSSHDGTIRIWEVASRTKLTALEHGVPVESLAISRDGQRIVSGGQDGSVVLWNAASGERLGLFSGHSAPVLTLDFSTDGQRIVSAANGSNEKSVRIWDVQSLKELRRLDVAFVNSASFSPDGSRIAVAGGGSGFDASLWDAESGLQLWSKKGHDRGSLFVAFAPKGDRIASAGADGFIRAWDAANGAKVWERNLGTEAWSVNYSPSGNLLVTTTKDGVVRLIEASNGEPMGSLGGHEGNAAWATFSPDGEEIVSVAENEATVWRVAWVGNLYERARSALPRCLTPDQRINRFFLDAELAPPRWCVEMGKWPYGSENVGR